MSLQRRPVNLSKPSEIPPIVYDVLRSPGQPLDDATRDFFESRFGHDFSRVRVHTDDKASKSARAVNSLAYTVGQDIAFGTGQYSPRASEGRKLLAHELAHVAQQQDNTSSENTSGRISSPGDASEWGADRAAEAVLGGSVPADAGRPFFGATLFRKVGSMNCPANIFDAPPDPKAALEAVDPIAVNLADQAADGLAIDAEDIKSGISDSPTVTFQSYQNHFGLPNAIGDGFLNRLTGIVRPSQEVAMSEELHILSRRFRFIGRLFRDTVNYRCPGNATFTIPGCAASSCGTSFAFSCRGGGTIALCNPFWSKLESDEAKAAALIHEASHIILGPTGLGTPGEIGEVTQRGPGRNFNIAGCYEFIIDDMAGIDSFPVCPSVPSPPTFI